MRSESSAAMRAELARDFLPIVERLGDDWTPAVTVRKRPSPSGYTKWPAWAVSTIVRVRDAAQRDVLPFEVPRALAHEWSHAAGFGDEGDANLIGSLTCLRSTDR